ncbi:Mitochondrial 2-oxodicarboxylate carrier 2 [Phytophthora cinnamomi]|uniref:Mitochondrial 2-oxodicarboxylate carrier 2 n=1 Tax=Phytophthora cinnamomi TaxID=4785 RepID=UPI00355A9C32|nr:Mitochondrial 2-oxodicarboxylate carrier 2 [Phytophthora cinnamomi]
MLGPYEARRRRSEWPGSVRQDPEIKELDEENGEWVLCRTCAEHYERTRRGRKPNDPKGFKVKMNGRFQEAAWAMHKSRVVAHRGAQEMATETPEELQRRLERRREIEMEVEARRGAPKRPRVASSDEADEEEVSVETRDERAPRERESILAAQLVHLPTTGWRCPGVVPDAFYREHMELVHAFAKYYVGSYRVNVVRDLRSDKVLLFSHDCENEVVHRERPGQPDSCERCYAVWQHNKSFKRILKKMGRYVLVEDTLRRSWSLSAEDLSVLSKFKHSSDMNLNIEGRKLKQAAMAAVQHYGLSAKSPSTRSVSARSNANSARSERFDRVQQPLSMEDHSKKQEELNAEGVEIVVQKPAHDRRLKLALPDITSIQIRSPVGPMKSSIRSALKELRSRQMVQSLCSRFESRLKVSSDSEECKKEVAKKSAAASETVQARTRRRDARDGRDATVAPVLLASELAKEAEITANARSNNLNKFLRSYASNLDNAVSAERRVSLNSDAISVERRVVMSTDAEDEVEQPLLANMEETEVPTTEAAADSDESSMELDLDLHTLQLESEFSNQVDSPSTADSEAEMEVAVLVDSTDCEPPVDESLDESDEGNNNVDTKRSTFIPSLQLSKAFTPADSDEQLTPEFTRSSDSKPEICADPPAKLALSRFKQQVPSNGRRARGVATLNI